MKTALLIISAASLMGGETLSSPDQCAAPAASSGPATTRVGQFDPLVLDLKGDKVAAPQTCDHAINTKGTGATGRVKGTTAVNNDVPVRATQNTQVLRHAINTKGTGASGKVAPGPGGDCDDTSALSSAADAPAPADSLIKVRVDPDTDGTLEARTAMAIKCKGTGAQ